MSSPLVEEGWVAPDAPGPTRRTALALVGAGAALVVVGWGLFGSGWLGNTLDAEKPQAVNVTISDAGEVVVDGRTVESEQRRRVASDISFLVARTRVMPDRSRIAASVEPPAGIDADAIAVRTLQPDASSDDAELLVTIPLASLANPPAREAEAKPLREVTEPFDERVGAQRADRRRQLHLRDSWWWIALLALAAAVLAPLLAWRIARSRWFSMRLPGPGKQLDMAPPSSIDPIGAAVLVAGASPVDGAAAFAGHLLDLVERRRLPMRRSTTTPPGLGTLVGMHHADEVDDVAIPVLGELVDEGGHTVVLPDTPAKVRRLSPAARATWHDHIAARAAFERVVERPDARVVAFAAAVAALGTLGSAIGWLIADGHGERSTLLLAATTLLAATATLVACTLDVRRWRVVARSRRTERAQWLAWRSLATSADGPASDQRNLPVLVAIGAPLTSLRGTTSATAVDLDAVTTKTVASLRAAFDPS